MSESSRQLKGKELEELVQRNIARNKAMIEALFQSANRDETHVVLQPIQNTHLNFEKKKIQRKTPKVKFIFETRRSTRIQQKPPVYIETDLEELEPRGVKRKLSLQNSDLARSTIKRARIDSPPCAVLPVDQVTPAMISKIAKKSTNKMLSINGTTCHQCRQKTLDTKSACRSGYCIGIRGQFCGPCLSNHYGEKVETVLFDEEWACPCCKGECNCSICRRKNGKTPTGIITPFIQKQGFNSVRDFLKSYEKSDEQSNSSSDKIISIKDLAHGNSDFRGFTDSLPIGNLSIAHLKEDIGCYNSIDSNKDKLSKMVTTSTSHIQSEIKSLKLLKFCTYESIKHLALDNCDFRGFTDTYTVNIFKGNVLLSKEPDITGTEHKMN